MMNYEPLSTRTVRWVVVTGLASQRRTPSVIAGGAVYSITNVFNQAVYSNIDPVLSAKYCHYFNYAIVDSIENSVNSTYAFSIACSDEFC